MSISVSDRRSPPRRAPLTKIARGQAQRRALSTRPVKLAANAILSAGPPVDRQTVRKDLPSSRAGELRRPRIRAADYRNAVVAFRDQDSDGSALRPVTADCEICNRFVLRADARQR